MPIRSNVKSLAAKVTLTKLTYSSLIKKKEHNRLGCALTFEVRRCCLTYRRESPLSRLSQRGISRPFSRESGSVLPSQDFFRFVPCDRPVRVCRSPGK